MEKKYNIPNPIINEKEKNAIDALTERYNKLIKPSNISKLTKNVEKIVPQKIKELGNSISEKQIMKLIEDGFKTIEELAAKYSVNENEIIKKVNKISNYKISKLNEVCLIRSYDLATLVNSYKTQDIFTAMLEGAGTGVFGFVGLPFNIILSTFLFFRAVQSIAMFYGYDIKNDTAELLIAADVFTKALNPSEGSTDNEVTNIIGKIIVMTQAEIVKQTSTKSWEKMASKGGASLLLTQMRALANKSAQKALNKVGKNGLEKSIFKDTFEQIGKKITLKSSGKLVYGFSVIFSALVDTNQMKKVLDFADIFYQKRFILEKEQKINELLK